MEGRYRSERFTGSDWGASVRETLDYRLPKTSIDMCGFGLFIVFGPDDLLAAFSGGA